MQSLKIFLASATAVTVIATEDVRKSAVFPHRI